MFNGSIKSIWERSCRTHFRHHKLEFSCLLETFLVLGQNCGLLSGIQVVVVKLSEGVAFVRCLWSDIFIYFCRHAALNLEGFGVYRVL